MQSTYPAVWKLTLGPFMQRCQTTALSAYLVISMPGVMGQQEPQKEGGNTSWVWMELSTHGEAMLETTRFQCTKNNSVLRLHWMDEDQHQQGISKDCMC